MSNFSSKERRRPINQLEYQLFSEQCSKLIKALQTLSSPMNKILGMGKFDSKSKNWFVCFRPLEWDSLKGKGFGVFWELRLSPSYTTPEPVVYLTIGVERPMEGDPKEHFKRNVIESARMAKVLPRDFSCWPQAGKTSAKLISKDFGLSDKLAINVLEQLESCQPFMDLVANGISQYAEEYQGNDSGLLKPKRIAKNNTQTTKGPESDRKRRNTGPAKSMSTLVFKESRSVSGGKAKRYADLVASRRACSVCFGLENPSKVEGGKFDSTELGPWTRWQGNLNSDILVVGQDWGDVDCLLNNKGIEPAGNPTNQTLMKLFQDALGISLCEPNSQEPNSQPAFFTNSILCLKRGGLQGEVRDSWFENCGEKFLKETINLVQPRIVVTLGEKAFRTMEALYGFPRKPFKAAVDNSDPFLIPGGARLFPMYHCGAWILNTHRKFPEQLRDWKRIKQAYQPCGDIDNNGPH